MTLIFILQLYDIYLIKFLGFSIFYIQLEFQLIMFINRLNYNRKIIWKIIVLSIITDNMDPISKNSNLSIPGRRFRKDHTPKESIIMINMDNIPVQYMKIIIAIIDFHSTKRIHWVMQAWKKSFLFKTRIAQFSIKTLTTVKSAFKHWFKHIISTHNIEHSTKKHCISKIESRNFRKVSS